MSDLAATNCGCGCDDSCTGNSGCGLGRCFGDCNSIIWILLILCCCGNGNNGCGCGQHNGYGNDCNCIIILLLLLCGCGGNNFC
ncbi:chorion class high-cysteine HCB protein 13 [Blautia stercoris]|uniref:Chorion class high-cysteine HCB protein 13 n=1 Tax=Blautia stercoris TaxID=871664 RepID=A0ABR7PAE5_9FIRM|nr:chorion class high-cysteine HCB protein 13 [Blautia stercoris]MBC8628385.1 chorion class high-cysteine HCB protein 13 [Blautia stercoris]RGF22281.1 chorion class high-cysteine HCB protein 13 [Firmicutes bacterium AM10-47]RHV46518.1 chorion class high-cysteine HCB protein 13 [Firmicutes bacterium OM04-13BH]